jgi:homoserine dehydrogenase
MNTASATTAPAARSWPRAQPASRPTQLVLIGTGQVGRALLARLARPNAGNGGDTAQSTSFGQQTSVFRLVAVANSRRHWEDANGIDPVYALDVLFDESRGPAVEIDALLARHSHGRCIIVDATASDEIAARHAHWLTRGFHVVTANKLGSGGALPRWRAIQRALERARVFYGDSATVGAGLPFLATIRALRTGGDRIRSLQGVLSGTLAWLFDQYDGTRPFSELVEQATRLGYTEPDPWQDLGGADVVRKLLALVRSTGAGLCETQIAHDALVAAEQQGDWATLDAEIDKRFKAAAANGQVLHHVASWRENGQAEVALRALDARHPLAARGAVNRLVVSSCRYENQPLLIEGPGAGPGVTAAALFDDLLRARTFA